MNRLYAPTATLLLSGGLAVAQGQGLAPGFNPSNPQDLTNRGNPQDLTLPGASNPQDLVRSPALPRAISPGPGPGTVGTSSLGLSLGHTYTVKAGKKFRRKRAPES